MAKLRSAKIVTSRVWLVVVVVHFVSWVLSVFLPAPTLLETLVGSTLPVSLTMLLVLWISERKSVWAKPWLWHVIRIAGIVFLLVIVFALALVFFALAVTGDHGDDKVEESKTLSGLFFAVGVTGSVCGLLVVDTILQSQRFPKRQS